MAEVIMMIGLLNLLAAPSVPEGFRDHGPAVPLAERRGVVAARDGNGKNLAIACSMDLGERGWILVTDIDTGETKQHFCPEGVPNSPPYGSLLSKSGKFYTSQGGTFLEFDPTAREWTFHGVPAPDEHCYLTIIEDESGTVYAGGYPHTHLITFDPKTRQMTDHGKMDPEEAYLSQLAVDRAGWVYCGIGTARHNLVAFHPKTKERRQLVREEDRKIGTASAYQGTDGKVYGHAGGQWYELSDGQATPIEEGKAAPRADGGDIGWGSILRDYPDGRKIRAYDLEDKWMEIEDPGTGKAKRITFDYKSPGSDITVLIGGPEGTVYGCTGHPCRAFTCNPKTGAVEYRPGQIYWLSAATQGRYIIGSEYSGGHLYIYDPGQPWNLEGEEDKRNPRLVARYTPDINLPRATLGHPDGLHVMMTGLPGYGYRGGGMAIYNLQTGESVLMTHKELIPEQSTLTMRALPNGEIIAGTTIEGGHGAKPVATEGVLYILDWQARKVVFQTVPVPGASEVRNIEIGPDGLIYGIAAGSAFFVFDPQSKQVVHKESLSGYGGPVRDGLLLGPDGQLYALFTKAIVRITPKTFAHHKLADAPGAISLGVAIQAGRIYFAIGSHLWSYGLPER